jgi:hypothetical protein
MQVANTEVIATPERSATNADLAVFYEDDQEQRSKRAPRPTFDHDFTLPRAQPPGLVVSAAAMTAATEASAVPATETTAAEATTTKSATTEPA